MFAAAKSLVATLESPTYEPEKPPDPKKPPPYEIRNYEKSTWVTTCESSIEEPSKEKRSKKNSEMFFKLFNYISGRNDKSQKIDMTVPVLKKITPGAGPFCKTKTEMSFYVTKEFQGDPPVPSAEDVYVTHLPAQRVVVKTFGGFTSEAKDLEEATALAEMTQDKYELEQDYYFTAGYNSPWRLFGRSNEIWFVIKGEKQGPEVTNGVQTENGTPVEGPATDKPAEPAAE